MSVAHYQWTMDSVEFDCATVREIIAALPGYWRELCSHSGSIYTISRDGEREVKTIWIDTDKKVHEVDRAEMKRSGRVISPGGLDPVTYPRRRNPT